jgi:hypothetical protein
VVVVAGRIPLDRIDREARQVHFWRSLLTMVGGLLFGVGWLAAKVAGACWLALVWSVTAVRLGWQEGRRGSARSD